MENSSTAIIMAGQVLLFVAAITIGIRIYSNFQYTVNKIITTSENNSMNSEYKTTLSSFERYATKAEIINTILSMKKDKNVVEDYYYVPVSNGDGSDSEAVTIREYFDTSFIPSKVIVNCGGTYTYTMLEYVYDNEFGYNDTAGLQKDDDVFDVENDRFEDIDEGYYKIKYNVFDSHNIEIEYTYYSDDINDL